MCSQHNIFKPKKKSEKRELVKVQVVQPNRTSWHKLVQVEQMEQVDAGLQIYVEEVEQEQAGLQIDVEQVEQEQGVCPVEPLHLTQSGTTRPWNICGRILIQFTGLLATNTVTAKFDLLAERTCLGKSVSLVVVVIPLNPEGMGIGDWVILFSENFEGMGMGMGNSKKLCA